MEPGYLEHAEVDKRKKNQEKAIKEESAREEKGEAGIMDDERRKCFKRERGCHLCPMLLRDQATRIDATSHLGRTLATSTEGVLVEVPA